MVNNQFPRFTPKWVSADFGTPSKEVQKVLVKTADGSITECTYNRHNRTWTKTGTGGVVSDVKAWALLPDSLPARRST